MYLFVTYATPGIKGIQARGIKIAKFFKNNEIAFINSGDDDWLKDAGLNYKNVNFDALYDPEDVEIPQNTQAVVFCDAPTNKPYQTALLVAAQKRKIPCIVIGNIYKRGQLDEKVPVLTEQYSDLYLRTGLSFFKEDIKKHGGRVEYIPPYISDTKLSDEETRETRDKFGLKPDDRVVLATGYNKEVFAKILKLEHALSKAIPNLKFICPAASKEVERKGNFILTPLLDEDEFRRLICVSELVICKRGFLQIVEALAIGRPVITLGEFKGYDDRWIDEKILNVVFHSDDVTEKLISRAKSLLSGDDKILSEIRKLHDGSCNGAELSAKMIRDCKFISKQAKKRVIISLDGKPEVGKLVETIKKDDFLTPIVISLPYLSNEFDKVFHSDLSERLNLQVDENLKYGFSLIYNFSFHDFHSAASMLPSFEELMSNLKKLINESDELFIVGTATEDVITPILDGKKYSLILVK